MRNQQVTRFLPTVGTGRSGNPAANRAALAMAPFMQNRTLKCEWNVTTAQPPSYIAVMLQKSTDVYTHSARHIPLDWDADAVAVASAHQGVANEPRTNTIELQGYSRNQSKLASVVRFQLKIQSSVGAYEYSSDTFPYLRDRAQLWADVQKYCQKDYCGSDVNVWKKHNCVILLGADAWLRGISTIGTAYPLQISCTAEFQNESEFFDGAACVQLRRNEAAKCSTLKDFIDTRNPVLLCIYDKARLSVSPSAAILSSQNLSHATAMDLIARR